MALTECTSDNPAMNGSGTSPLSFHLPAILSGFLPTDPTREVPFMLGTPLAIGGVSGQPRIELSGPGAVIHVFHGFCSTLPSLRAFPVLEYLRTKS